MAKNLMPEIIKMIGVEYGERFKLRIAGKESCEAGLSFFTERGNLMWISSHNEVSESNDEIFNILSGFYEVVKLPWEPKNCDDYYILNVETGRIECYSWGATTFDLAVKSLGIIYRTEEEAKAHMSEDYERLTGEKLEEQKIPWEPQRGESYYAISVVDHAYPKIAHYDWNGSASDYECLEKGLVHKTQAEAEEHFAEDYERLTGKELKG